MAETRSTLKISKRLKLIKTVREVYKRCNIDFIPPDIDFSKPILILNRKVIADFSTILLADCYHFVICNCVVEDEDLKQIQRLNPKIIHFKDEFVEELTELCEEKRLGQVLEYLKMQHQQGSFYIVTEDNLETYCQGREFYDVVLSNTVLPADPETGFTVYMDNLEHNYMTGSIRKGILMINPLNNLEGEVIEKERRTKIRGTGLNRALQNDEVYIQGNRVVGLQKKKIRIPVGTIISIRDESTYRIGLVRPLDRRLPDIEVVTSLTSLDLNKKVVVHVLEWPVDSRRPRGVIFKILGPAGVFENEIEAIFEHFQIKYFKESWLETCIRRRLEKVGYDSDLIEINQKNVPIPSNSSGSKSKKMAPEDLFFNQYHFSIERAIADMENGKRTDLRHLDVCSIDPEGCEDIDDALHCIKHDGYIEVGVHIADVSFYVLPDSVLDLEAKNRSTTVYFPDRRIDMLPPFLSSDLCSLHQDQTRAAFSCVMTLDLDFQVRDVQIFRSLIKSRAAFTYERANDIIKGKEAHGLKESLKLLLEIATALRKQRFDGGALELNAQEVHIDKRGEIKVKEHVPTHYLVEEFMLLANINVARFIYKHNPDYSLLRMHPLPSSIELDIVDASTSKTLNDSLKKLKEEQAVIVKRVITRSMQQAVYFCSGESSDFYHYGLATEIYTHFTSPIRRYPDILVHRTLGYIIEGRIDKIDGLKEYVNEKACFWMNFRHRNAQNAARMAVEVFTLCGLEEKDYLASVVAVKENGVAVFIRECNLEGFINTDKKYELFDNLKVRISKNLDEYFKNRSLVMTIL